MKIAHKLVAASVLAGAFLAAAPAQAVSFNLINTGGAGAGSQARMGFEIATRYWSSVLTDDVTINLQIGFQSLAPNVLGQTGSNRSLLSMNQAYTALALDASSTLDVQSIAGLQPLGVSALGPTFGAVTAVANGINATNNGYVDDATRIDNDGSVNNSTLAITKATAKALGLTVDVNGQAINYNTADAGVTFSSNFAFDFNPTDGITAGSFDFIGVAIHEIGHALGFTSGVDSYDVRTGPNGTQATGGLLEGFVVMNTLDLWRYSAPGVLDWSTSDASKYFSLDGGVSQVFGDSRFSLGSFNGDGRQASHWKDSPSCTDQLGIMDPTFCNSTVGTVEGLDLAAFDVIGWNLRNPATANYSFTTAEAYTNFVPEPATWAMMIAGFGFVGASMRRAKAQKTAFAA